MRISTSQMHQNAAASILEQQVKAARTENQIASGKRVLTPSDDPIAAPRIDALGNTIKSLEQYQTNISTARQRLEVSESTLGFVSDVLVRARELAVQGNNASQSPDTRRMIAKEVRELAAQALANANTRDANGEYLFGGYRTGAQPFTTGGAGYAYNGDAGVRFVQVGPGRQIATGLSGEVFRDVRNGNGTFSVQADAANGGTAIADAGTVTGNFVRDTYTLRFIQAAPTDPVTYEVRDSASGLVASGTYTSGAAITFAGASINVTGTPFNNDRLTIAPAAPQDIFTTLSNLAQTLEQGGGSGAAQAGFHNAMNRALTDIGQAEDAMLRARAELGSRLNALDLQQDENEVISLQASSGLSLLKDLDYAEAISRLNRELLGLEAAQQAYVRVQGLSLFKLLR